MAEKIYCGSGKMQSMGDQRRVSKEMIEKSMPPKEVRVWMKKIAEETEALNGGESFDKQCFTLGMLAMWHHLNLKHK